MKKIKAMMELKDQFFSSLPQRLTIVDVFAAYENASSRRIALYSSFDYIPVGTLVKFHSSQIN